MEQEAKKETFFQKLHRKLRYVFAESKFGKFWIKAHLQYLALAGLMFAFKAILYFVVAYIPCTPVKFHMEVDTLIPFIPEFYLFYLSYYILPVIFLWILSFYDKKKMVTIVFTTFSVILIAYICYLIQQVQMDREQFEIIAGEYHDFSKVNSLHTFFLWAVDKQYQADETALNCFPSLHATLGTATILVGVFTGKDEKRFPIWLRILSIVLGVGITISTVFVKQHYLVDIIFAFGLEVLLYFLFKLLIFPYFIKKAAAKKASQIDNRNENC